MLAESFDTDKNTWRVKKGFCLNLLLQAIGLNPLVVGAIRKDSILKGFARNLIRQYGQLEHKCKLCYEKEVEKC